MAKEKLTIDCIMDRCDGQMELERNNLYVCNKCKTELSKSV